MSEEQKNGDDEVTTPGRPLAGYALDLVDVVQGPPVDPDAITEVRPPVKGEG